MDNDDAMVGTIWSRRQALRMGLGSLIGGTIAANFIGCAADGKAVSAPVHQPLVVSPALTEGPFFVDEKLNRSNLLAGVTRPTVINGMPLQMNLTVLKLDSTGNTTLLTGAQVDVWHCDTLGIYSDENNPMNAEVTSGQRWLRGYQIVDASGVARFSTIVPGWYQGRTPHIHFKVRQFSPANKQTAEFTSQFFFADDMLDRIYANPPYAAQGRRNMLNMDDGIFSEPTKDGSLSSTHQLLPLTQAHKGYGTQFTIVVTEASLHDRTEHGPGGPGGGPSGGPGGPGGGPGFGPPPGGPPDDGFWPPPM